MSRSTMRFAYLLALCVSACQAPLSDGDQTSNLSGDGNALRPTLPLLTNDGGAVLANPDVIVVVWPGDEDVGAQARAIVDAAMGTPGYWNVLAQYGVGAGTTEDIVVLPDGAPPALDDLDLQTFLDGAIADGTLPSATPSTLYLLLPPATTSVSMEGGCGCGATAGCNGSFQGYHHETPGQAVYGVSLRCFGAALSDDDTGTLTHELAEAATDPHYLTSPGWQNNHSRLGEIADLCGFASTPLSLASGQTVAASQLWSNADASAASGNPCQPSTSPYFNVAVAPNTTIVLDANGNGEGKIDLLPFADPGITGLNYTLQATLETGGLARTIFFSANDADFGNPIAGSATPGTATSLHVRVTHGAPTANGYPLSVYAQHGADTQSWAGTLSLVR